MKKCFKLFNWGLLSKHRVSLMACAIIWVFLHHGAQMGLKLPSDATGLKLFLRRGNMGVDIFLLLSGIGLYFSYRKNEDALSFYLKRIKRVLLPYLLIGGGFWFVTDLLWKKDIVLFLKDITLISFWKDGITRSWYIALILFLYALFPLIWKMVYRNGQVVQWRTVLTILAVITINFALGRYLPDWFAKVEIALMRIPVFLVGIALADKVWEKQPVNVKEIVILVVLCSCKLLMNAYHIKTGFQRYWFAVWAIVICLILAALFELCEKNKVLCKLKVLLAPMGTWSLELYIVHVWVRRFILKADVSSAGYGIVNFGLLVVISAVVTWCAVWMEKRIIFQNRK